jgi:hypothetical protein
MYCLNKKRTNPPHTIVLMVDGGRTPDGLAHPRGKKKKKCPCWWWGGLLLKPSQPMIYIYTRTTNIIGKKGWDGHFLPPKNRLGAVLPVSKTKIKSLPHKILSPAGCRHAWQSKHTQDETGGEPPPPPPSTKKISARCGFAWVKTVGVSTTYHSTPPEKKRVKRQRKDIKFGDRHRVDGKSGAQTATHR